MKQKILAIMGTILLTFAGLNILAPQTAAALGGGNCNAPTFLGFKPWFEGLCSGDAVQEPSSEDELISFVWTVILNVLFDLILAVGYLAVGFIIYGGYLYIISQGDPGRATKAKKTLTSAIVGTVIALVATVAVNTIRIVLGINANDGWRQDDFTQTQVEDAFGWAYSVAGIVAVIFIIKGGFDYLLSRGDPGKVKTATQSIIYAVVGLVIVIMAAVITSFITDATGGALQ